MKSCSYVKTRWFLWVVYTWPNRLADYWVDFDWNSFQHISNLWHHLMIQFDYFACQWPIDVGVWRDCLEIVWFYYLTSLSESRTVLEFFRFFFKFFRIFRIFFRVSFELFFVEFELTVFKCLQADKSGTLSRTLFLALRLSNLVNFRTLSSVSRLTDKFKTFKPVKSSICRGYRERRLFEASSERSFVSWILHLIFFVITRIRTNSKEHLDSN